MPHQHHHHRSHPTCNPVPLVKRRRIIGVMGSGRDPHADMSSPLGRWLATTGHHLLTGGGRGVMETVSRSFAEVEDRKGMIIGVVPSLPVGHGGEAIVPPPGYPNPYCELVIRTHLPLSTRPSSGTEATSRNHVNILSSDVIIVLPGSTGTWSEVQLAYRYRKPLVLFLGVGGKDVEIPSDEEMADLKIAETLDEVIHFVEDAIAKADRNEAARGAAMTAQVGTSPPTCPSLISSTSSHLPSHLPSHFGKDISALTNPSSYISCNGNTSHHSPEHGLQPLGPPPEPAQPSMMHLDHSQHYPHHLHHDFSQSLDSNHRHTSQLHAQAHNHVVSQPLQKQQQPALNHTHHDLPPHPPQHPVYTNHHSNASFPHHIQQTQQHQQPQSSSQMSGSDPREFRATTPHPYDAPRAPRSPQVKGSPVRPLRKLETEGNRSSCTSPCHAQAHRATVSPPGKGHAVLGSNALRPSEEGGIKGAVHYGNGRDGQESEESRINEGYV